MTFLSDPGMVPITDHPDLVWLDNPLVWRDDQVTVIIPAGFISDDASVPKALDWIPFLDRQGLSRRPGLLHDGVYSLGREKGKEWADRLLRVACLAEGMTHFQATCYYQGVHLFGTSAWAKDAHAGTYGEITSGDFVSHESFDAWVAAGSTIFYPPGIST